MFMVRLMMTSHVLLIAWVLDIDLAGKSTRIGRRLQFELHSNLENCSVGNVLLRVTWKWKWKSGSEWDVTPKWELEFPLCCPSYTCSLRKSCRCSPWAYADITGHHVVGPLRHGKQPAPRPLSEIHDPAVHSGHSPLGSVIMAISPLIRYLCCFRLPCAQALVR